MKLNIFRIVLPVVVVAFAIFGAASSDSISKGGTVVADVQGWYHISPTQPCVASSMCNEQGTEVCTVNNIIGGQQLYRKDGAQSCEFTLYKPTAQ